MNIGRLAAGREEYYLSQVADGVEDYYLSSGEAAGRWAGSGAALAGVAGEVVGDDLRTVLAGRTPAGVPLAGPGRKTPGFDLTFRAPKSVSLLHALGDPATVRQVVAAHDQAVAECLEYLEAHACFARRGPQGRQQVRGDGFVAAEFRHRTSRNGDPQLHTHLLLANAVRADGRWSALDGRLLYGEAKTASYLYQAVLRAELTERLGVDWQPVRYGMADIAGFTRPVIEAFSTRRREILAQLDRRGEHSASAAQVATLATRKAKGETDSETLRAEWRQRAAEHGLTGDVLASTLHCVDGRSVGMPDATVEGLLSPAGLTRRRSSFTRRDVVQAWCNQLPHGGHLPTVESLTAATLEDPELIELAGSELDARFRDSLRRRDGRYVPSPAAPSRFTTREMLEVERQLLDAARTGESSEVAVVAEEVVEAALAVRPSLGPEQRHMVRSLTGSGDALQVVVGKAGAGKTHALDAARAAWQASGHVVIGTALAARAAAQLQADAGIPAGTLARLERVLTRRPLPPKSVVIVDEAAMVGTRQLARLAAMTGRARAKLVLVGDDRQLPAIDAGGGFCALTRTVIPVRLDVNRRQTAEWERIALDQLASGRTQVALAAYQRHGRIIVAPSAEEVRDLLVADWHEHRRASGTGPMLALHRSDVDDLNQRARQRLKVAGDLGETELPVGGRMFAVGDEVIGRRNDYRAGILNGTRGVITALHPDAETVTMRTAEGEQITLHRGYLQRGLLDHAYAITVHKSQGATFDRAFLLGDDRLYREAGYVALSRAKDTTRIYTVAANPGDEHRTHRHTPAVDELSRVLATSRAEQSLHELTVGR